MVPAYRRKDNFIHRLHPASMLLLVLALMVIALIADNPFFQLGVIFATAILALAAGVVREWFSWWKICAVVGVATMIINPLVSREGATVIWRGPLVPVLGSLKITAEAIAFGAGMGLRLVAVIWVFALLTLAVDPDSVLGMLRGRGSRSALLSALTLRMVPTTMRDAQSLLDAQRSRGLALDEGSRWAVLKSRLPMVKKTLSTSLDRGIGLAEAMESRAYGSGRRTRYAQRGFGAGDIATVSAAVILLAACVVGVTAGPLSFKYYPSISAEYGAWTLFFVLAPVVVAALLAALSWWWIRSNWLRSRT
jgi:energy-coupling factor transport system permease protein